MNQDMLKGKTAIITGCNRGIGKAILEQYAKNGANCVACVKTTNKEFEAYCKKLEIDSTCHQYGSFDKFKYFRRSKKYF